MLPVLPVLPVLLVLPVLPLSLLLYAVTLAGTARGRTRTTTEGSATTSTYVLHCWWWSCWSGGAGGGAGTAAATATAAADILPLQVPWPTACGNLGIARSCVLLGKQKLLELTGQAFCD